MRNAAMNSGYYVHEAPTQKPKLQSKKEIVKKTVYKTAYDKKTDTFNGGSKKEVTVTAPTLKSKTQVSTPTKQEVKKPVVGSKENPKQLREITVTPTKQSTTVNNQKTTVKPKEEVKTTPKQTYLKPKEPKGEVNMKVKLFQKMLLDEGLDLGKEGADGIWGEKTQTAFEKLQANKSNYAIAMEKFKQLDEELQPKTIEGPSPFTTRAPFQMNNAIRPEAMPAFPTPESAYMNQNSQQSNDSKSLLQQLNENRIKEAMKTPHSYLKKGGIMKPKKKKCSCGCAMKISKNAKGGLIESCACGCNMKKHDKGGKVTTNDSIQAHNRLNAGESESGKGPQTKQEVINRLRKGNFGPGNTKAGFDKELKNKK